MNGISVLSSFDIWFCKPNNLSDFSVHNKVLCFAWWQIHVHLKPSQYYTFRIILLSVISIHFRVNYRFLRLTWAWEILMAAFKVVT